MKRGEADSARYPAGEDRRGKIRLDLNESPWGASPLARQALARLAGPELARYPDAQPLTRALARHLGVAKEQLLLTNGSGEAIRLVAQACLEPDDEVLLPVPAFSLYPQFLEQAGAKLRPVPYRPDFSFPLEELLEAISPRTRLVVVTDPGSPIGSRLRPDELQRLLAATRGSRLLLDGAYAEYAGAPQARLVRRHPHLLALGTFSKAYGLAALRVGWVAAAAPTVRRLRRLSPPFSVSSAGLAAAEAALADTAFLRQAVRKTRHEVDFLASTLARRGLAVVPGSGNSLLFRAGALAPFVVSRLHADGVLVRDVGSQPGLSGCIRVSPGRRRDNLRLLARLRPMCPPPAILFDMDGVLIDVRRSYRLAIRRTAGHFLGTTVDAADVRRLKTRGGFNDDWLLTAELVAAGGCAVPFARIVARFQLEYAAVRAGERWQAAGELLARLRLRYRLGIVTGRPRAEALEALERSGCRSLFDVVVCREDCRRQKPHPEGIRLALRRLACPGAVFVGDSVDDMRAAAGAGLPAIGVGAGCGRHLRSAGAAAVIERVNSIEEVLP